jgi:hypothetical protein
MTEFQNLHFVIQKGYKIYGNGSKGGSEVGTGLSSIRAVQKRKEDTRTMLLKHVNGNCPSPFLCLHNPFCFLELWNNVPLLL